MTENVMQVLQVEELFAIKVIGIVAVTVFQAEIGDIGHFDLPIQIQKYSGLEPVENSSGNTRDRQQSESGAQETTACMFQITLP